MPPGPREDWRLQFRVSRFNANTREIYEHEWAARVYELPGELREGRFISTQVADGVTLTPKNEGEVRDICRAFTRYRPACEGE